MEIQYTFFFAAVFALIFCMLAITAGEGVNTPWNFIRKLPVASAIR